VDTEEQRIAARASGSRQNSDGRVPGKVKTGSPPKWLRVGAAPNADPKKSRNDAVDTTIVAFATYFDGLLTDDAKAIELHRNASFLLKCFFIGQRK
jgi:hypothetical protein